MKHIESIQPEYAADDMTALLLSDATATAALSHLLHNVTGCAIPETSDLPESEVEELVPLCLSILRRHWATPQTALGDGNTPMSLADLMRQTIGDRVQGNEAWSIPPANADIPTAVAALRQRDMSSGLTLTLTDCTDGSTTSPTTTPLSDGLSLAQLLYGSDVADNVTEIKDSNRGWVMSKSISLPSIFANLKSVILNCIEIDGGFFDCTGLESINTPILKLVNTKDGAHATFYNVEAEEITINVEEVVKPSPHSRLIQGTTLKRINLPTLKRGNIGGNDTAFVYSPVLEELNMPSVEDITSNGQNCIARSNVLKKVVYGKLKTIPALVYAEESSWSYTKNLIHLEVGEGTECNLPFQYWQPTTALSERLPEFISNFQTYIADRVADMTGKTALTLTLSSAVYAVLEAQEGQTILATLANKNWNVAQA